MELPSVASHRFRFHSQQMGILSPLLTDCFIPARISGKHAQVCLYHDLQSVPHLPSVIPCGQGITGRFLSIHGDETVYPHEEKPLPMGLGIA